MRVLLAAGLVYGLIALNKESVARGADWISRGAIRWEQA
jgi:hypothetical protein